MKKVFAIVVTYKGMRWYKDCFDSLTNSSQPLEVVVIDNNSADGSAEYIHKNYPSSHLIESGENLGFGRANNIGMRYALDNGCDYVFLINQDAWIERDTIERLIDVAEHHKEYGILAPVQVNKEKTKVLDGVVDFLTHGDNTNKELISDLILGCQKEVYPVPEMNAAAWLISRKTLETVGGFDPLFLHYDEDWNYQSRAQYHGFKLGFTPDIHIVHDCVERVKLEDGYGMSYNKWMLQRAADPLYPDDEVYKMIATYRRRAIIKLLSLKWGAFLINWRALSFLRDNKAKIIASRLKNKETGATWL